MRYKVDLTEIGIILWYKYDKYHRLFGPAILTPDENNSWWI